MQDTSTLTLRQIKFAAQECERQESGEMSVFNMCQGIILATMQSTMTRDFLLQLAKLVEPKTGGRIREVNVRHGKTGDEIGIKPDLIGRALQGWVGGVTDSVLGSEEMYFEFEDIHPFIDGNGRVGAIVYNWYMGCINKPVTAPMYEGRDSRVHKAYGER